MEAQNTQAKTAEDTPVYIDEVDIFYPSENETARLREELQAEHDKYLRLAAEYENYRRRTKLEQSAAAENGKRELLLRLVSLADDFDLALANSKNALDNAIVEGLEIIARRLKTILDANGVIAFDSTNEFFNPELHEAFDVISAQNSKSGRVHSELRRGYLWNDKLLRPSLVIVTE